LLRRQNDSLLAEVQRLEGVLQTRRSSVSSGTQTLYDPSVVSPVASPLHHRQSTSCAAHIYGGGRGTQQPEPSAEVSALQPTKQISSDHHNQQQQQPQQQQQSQQQQQQQQQQLQQLKQQQQQQLLALQHELALAQQELLSVRKITSAVATARLHEDFAAAASETASEAHKVGLDAILQRLDSWDADVLAEVYRNGQLMAMHAPQQLQQHQQLLLTAPSSVTDVSISMKCVV
jgi:flagellar motor protein MotB